MNKTLGMLVSENLNLELFFNVSFDQNDIKLLAGNSDEVSNYLLSKGFEQVDYCYVDDVTATEYIKGNIRAVLFN